MFWVYALYSQAARKIYVGFTSNIEARIRSHNLLAKRGWTIKYRPWGLVYTEHFETKIQAMKREKELKSSKGRAFLWKLIKERNPLHHD